MCAFDARREFQRVEVDCSAQLVTPGSYRSAVLRDLSQTGARLELDEPPPEGTTALLRWQTHDTLCTVVWRSPVACGVAFVASIPEELTQTAPTAREERRTEPSARLTLINFGQRGRRKRPIVIAELAQEEGYSWTLPLRRQLGSPAELTAAEEMFFGSPLAHVALRDAEHFSAEVGDL